MLGIRHYQDNAFSRLDDRKSLTTETLRVLTSYLLDRTRGTYCVLVNGLVWDAEIILRSVYECFAKVMLISVTPEAERLAIVEEYWDTLSAIYDRKGAERSRAAEELASRYSEDDARIFRHLRDARLFRTAPTGIKRTRKEIEQRWSFSGIIGYLTGKGGIGKIIGLDALGHAYSMGSHVAHASPKAFDLLEDRTLRGSDLRALEVGHVCRILTDMTSLSCFSVYYAERSWTGTKQFPQQLTDSFNIMVDATRLHQERFARSQD